MRIVKQGAIRVNDCVVVYQNDAVACLELDLASKYAAHPTMASLNKGYLCYPMIYLDADKNTLHTHPDYPLEAATEVEFDDYEGWDIFCCSGPFRYTVRLVMMKRDTGNGSGSAASDCGIAG